MKSLLLCCAALAFLDCKDQAILDAKDKEIAELKSVVAKCETTIVRDGPSPRNSLGAVDTETAQPALVRGGFGLDVKGQLDRISAGDGGRDGKGYDNDKELNVTMGMPLETRQDQAILEIANEAQATFEQISKGGEHNAGLPVVLHGTISDIKETSGVTIAKAVVGWNKYFYLIARFTSPHVRRSRVEVVGYSAITDDTFENMPVIAVAALLKEGSLAKIKAAYKGRK